jgi:hypothetical protein
MLERMKQMIHDMAIGAHPDEFLDANQERRHELD